MTMHQLDSWGLTHATTQRLRSIFALYPEVVSVRLFGSRARGDYNSGSDIDLAVDAPALSPERLGQLCADIDGLDLLFEVDVVHLQAQLPLPLRHNIEREGVDFMA